jgi:hypothetical protein
MQAYGACNDYARGRDPSRFTTWAGDIPSRSISHVLALLCLCTRVAILVHSCGYPCALVCAFHFAGNSKRNMDGVIYLHYLHPLFCVVPETEVAFGTKCGLATGLDMLWKPLLIGR